MAESTPPSTPAQRHDTASTPRRPVLGAQTQTLQHEDTTQPPNTASLKTDDPENQSIPESDVSSPPHDEASGMTQTLMPTFIVYLHLLGIRQALQKLKKRMRMKESRYTYRYKIRNEVRPRGFTTYTITDKATHTL